MRILIAEDDASSLTLLKGLLKNHGHEVVPTTNGTEAWEALQRSDAPSLAILDWMMPGLDGPEVVRRIRALPTARPPYFIMLSGKIEKADIVAGLAAGANDYLAKPFDFGELLARVEVGRRMVEMQAALAAMNEKLMAERARYFDLYDRAPSGYITVSQPGLILEANLTAASLLGVAPRVLVGQPIFHVILKEDMESYYHLFKEVAESREPKSCDLRIVKSDGTPFWAHLAVTVAQSEGGAQVVRVVLSDITELKQAEGKLLQSESRMRAITNSAQDAILMMDPEGKITYWNPAAERIFGYAAAEAIGQNLHFLIAPARYHDAYHAAFPAFLKTGQGAAVGKTLDLEALRKDGEEIVVQLSLSAVQLQGTWHAVGILRDITARKRKEKELQTLRTAVEQSASTIVITDPQGRIEYVNPAFERSTGYATAEAIGQNPRILKSGEQAAAFYRDLWATITSGKIWRGEFHNKRKDHSLYWESATISPVLNDKGDLVCFIAIKEDITQKKDAEKKIGELQQRLSLSEQDERRRIAASLHDCTVQDLVAIQLNLNRAFEMLGEEHPAVREILGDCAALAESNASELRSLAYDLHAPWLQYGGLLSGIQEYAHHFSVRTGISVSVEAPPDIPRLPQFKQMALYRVMQESLINVHRHSGEKRAWILISLLDGELRMTIRDEGKTDTPGSNKAGVGILSMYERMSAIGGRLEVSRTPEGASTLAILPLGEEKSYGDNEYPSGR